MVDVIEGKENLVQKRSGTLEPFNQEKLYEVALWACSGSEVLATQLVNALTIKVHNKINIVKLYDELINTASNFISDMFPIWEEVAKNLYILKIHKDIGVKRATYPPYRDVYNNNVSQGFYKEGLIPDEWIDVLGDTINQEYDKLFGFGGLNLFVQKYCNKTPNGQLLELPQHTYMRVAIQLMHVSGLQGIIDKYHQIASHGVTEATPKMVNGFRPNAQLFSCCLARPEDSQESINIVDDLLGRESKYGGGLASDNSDIRAKGSVVEGNKGKSGGVVPFIQGTQWSVGRYNQGSTRTAAMAMYYNWFHYEAPEITELKSESGKDEDRARKLKYCVKWTKHLTDAIRANEDIFLFDSHKTKDMTYAWGDELRQLYNKYSKSTHVRKRKYSAREFAYQLAKIKLETGNNYTFFTDNANIQNIGGGTVTQSNLCVAGDTKILTQDGHKTIESIAGTTVSCWNGNEWSDTPLFKTSDAEHVLKVRLSNGSIIEATEYHKWYVNGGTKKQTNELKVGDILDAHNLHTDTTAKRFLEESKLYGIYSEYGTEYVEEVIDEGKVIPVYCGTEPKRHKLMFNGVLTGNCMEYMPNFEPIKFLKDELINGQMVRTYEGDIALCNLSSANIMKWVSLSQEEKRAFMKLLVTSMDNAIDVAFYANPLGQKHSMEHRNLGIGVSNYANWLASNRWLWGSKEAREYTHYLSEELQYYAIAASIELAKERQRFPLFHKSKWADGVFPHEISILHNKESELNYPLKMDWEALRPDLIKYGIRNEYLMAIAPTATSGQCIGATPGVDAPRKLKTIVEGTYSLPFVVPNLRENREFYQTTFQVPNKDTIELAAIRQKFICMGQSVSLAYANPDSAYEVINDIMYAEELGLKSLYYTYTPLPDDMSEEGCDSCGS
jgi:ribonucleotide reductase alpha subunit